MEKSFPLLPWSFSSPSPFFCDMFTGEGRRTRFSHLPPTFSSFSLQVNSNANFTTMELTGWMRRLVLRLVKSPQWSFNVTLKLFQANFDAQNISTGGRVSTEGFQSDERKDEENSLTRRWKCQGWRSFWFVIAAVCSCERNSVRSRLMNNILLLSRIMRPHGCLRTWNQLFLYRSFVACTSEMLRWRLNLKKSLEAQKCSYRSLNNFDEHILAF